VPLYWGQSGITAQLSFTKSREMSVTAFCHHADKLIEKYGHITMINLLSSSKAFESNLTNEWEAIFNKVFSNYSQHLSYTYFDFHSNCKGQKFHKINLLIERISNFLQYYCYYSSDGSKQQGVIRTNCLDCLDRTNVVQSSISWDVLMNMLRKVNKDYVIKQDASFVRAFKLQWADNGDYLSYQYTGTGSTISAVTREGSLGLKGLIMHGITSINRFYNATVHDDVKQTSIDAVLRKKNKTQIVNKIEEELNKCSQEYSQFIDIRIRVWE
jgi:phosphatidylinositol-bisphosphatase